MLDGLTVLSGYITLLDQSGPLTARQQDMLERLDRTAKALIDLLLPVRRNGL